MLPLEEAVSQYLSDPAHGTRDVNETEAQRGAMLQLILWLRERRKPLDVGSLTDGSPAWCAARLLVREGPGPTVQFVRGIADWRAYLARQRLLPGAAEGARRAVMCLDHWD